MSRRDDESDEMLPPGEARRQVALMQQLYSPRASLRTGERDLLSGEQTGEHGDADRPGNEGPQA